MYFNYRYIALRKAKIAYNFGLSECSRVKRRWKSWNSELQLKKVYHAYSRKGGVVGKGFSFLKKKKEKNQKNFDLIRNTCSSNKMVHSMSSNRELNPLSANHDCSRQHL